MFTDVKEFVGTLVISVQISVLTIYIMKYIFVVFRHQISMPCA